MATVMQHEELVRRALTYISDRKQSCPRLSFADLLDEASMRFNLSPRDQEALLRGIRSLGMPLPGHDQDGGARP